MKTLKNLLRENKEAIAEKWLLDSLASYQQEASSFFKKQKDQFANPVGHTLKTATLAILENLIDDLDAELVCKNLDDIIRIRSIQDFSPSQAVSFVFSLKRAVREVLGKNCNTAEVSAEMVKFEADVDQIALFAFDVFTSCRERYHDLRVNEIMRSVAGLTKISKKGAYDSPCLQKKPGEGIESI